MDCEQLDRRTMKPKPPTYRELYLRTLQSFCEEEGKYQRLLGLVRVLAKSIPKGSEGLKDWKEWDKHEREKRKNME